MTSPAAMATPTRDATNTASRFAPRARRCDPVGRGGSGSVIPRHAHASITAPRTRGRTAGHRSGSGLDAEPARRARTLASGPQPAKPLHEHRIGLESLRSIDQRVERLVVARGRHVELLAHGLLFGTRVLPPLTLELEDLQIAIRQPAAGFGVVQRV